MLAGGSSSARSPQNVQCFAFAWQVPISIFMLIFSLNASFHIHGAEKAVESTQIQIKLSMFVKIRNIKYTHFKRKHAGLVFFHDLPANDEMDLTVSMDS